MMMNNFRYYQSYLRPDALVLNSLAVIHHHSFWKLSATGFLNKINQNFLDFREAQVRVFYILDPHGNEPKCLVIVDRV